MNDAPPKPAKPRKRGIIKKFLPRTLFGRSLLILITPVLLTQVIVAFIFFDRHWGKMTSRLGYGIAGEIAVLSKMVEEEPDKKAVDRVLAFAAQNLDLLASFDKGAKIESEGNIVHGASVWEDMITQTMMRELDNQLLTPFSLSLDFQEKWFHVAVQLDKGVLNVSFPQRRLFSTSTYIFLLWMIGSSLVLLVIAIIFMRNQIRPIRKLAAAAERFGKGRDVATFKPEGAREVRQAAQAFIDMHRRIKRQVEQRTAMLAGVSHDLRTPLTRLKLQLAMLPDSSDMQSMRKDIQDMENMIGGYLDFVRGEGDEQAVLTDLSELLNACVASAGRQGIKVETDIERGIYLMLRPMAFERCLGNILGNAGRYASHAWLRARVHDGKVEITVEDDGPGIAADYYDDVFKPFYRLDSSRNADTGGVGLGLPIAMDIVHGHGGKIWLERSTKHGGLKVIIRLPL